MQFGTELEDDNLALDATAHIKIERGVEKAQIVW